MSPLRHRWSPAVINALRGTRIWNMDVYTDETILREGAGEGGTTRTGTAGTGDQKCEAERKGGRIMERRDLGGGPDAKGLSGVLGGMKLGANWRTAN